MNEYSLFKKAKKLLNTNQVSIENHNRDVSKQVATYYFKVKDYNVSVSFHKTDKDDVWKRDFNCDCKASIRNTKEMCSHTIACLCFLVNNA